ncbi:CmcI family methyltransferase [Candidatus Venteria ishoeyi]|uniref:CmcI family methyltransferase n=1 Tax=Candidatus Venteria ishoeyi TaxID=1899563 RepID=UPI0025A67833|nr:CmcI family methyltransferase [Candidatus Venteria ishoeyi]MDM8547091.1 CmcI family methyltransferase [Candidatus Venteria ishoeyi]
MKAFLNWLKKAWNFLTYTVQCIRYYKSIQRTGADMSAGQLVDAIFHRWGGILKPIQVPYEIRLFSELVEKNQPQTVLEIGTANGGTLFLFSRLADKNAHIISIDLPMGLMRLYFFIRLLFFKSIPLSGQTLNLLRSNSQKLITKKKIEKILNGKKIDLLYIDADHSYEGVKKDFELYSPLVTPGGIIVFHDIVHHPSGTTAHLAEVDRFWNEIKTQYHCVEIVENWNQWWAGIGILTKKHLNPNIPKCNKVI